MDKKPHTFTLITNEGERDYDVDLCRIQNRLRGDSQLIKPIIHLLMNHIEEYEETAYTNKIYFDLYSALTWLDEIV